jgi:putative cardiolipin synthase
VRDSRCGVARRAYNLLLALLLLGAASCASIPKNPAREKTYSLPAADAGRLTELSDAALARGKQGESAFMRVAGNADAMRWRLALIDSAEQSIDLQVFIWSNDESGRLLLSRILDASQRGVRVRLLVDDMPKDWSDKATALVARQPNVHLRRFNVGRTRKGLISRTLQMSLQFRRLNRRMHNKLMVIDGRWAVVGGRNIGNPYFGVSKKYNNIDLDLLVTGPSVKQMAESFDVYWNSDAAYPGSSMHGEISERKSESMIKKFGEVLAKDREKLWDKTAVLHPREEQQRALGRLPDEMLHGLAIYLQDSPKVSGDRGERLLDQIHRLIPASKEMTCLVTPYLLPSSKMLGNMSEAVKAGRKARLIVPSMESNNHTMVHTHYKKYRRAILETGAEIYELKGQPGEGLRRRSDTSPVKSQFISLHAKLIVQDADAICIGSLNLDPRSVEINTENMLYVKSPELARQFLDDIEMSCSGENAWQVYLDEDGNVRWTDGKDVRSLQPARGFIQRCKATFYRMLPVESQL